MAFTDAWKIFYFFFDKIWLFFVYDWFDFLKDKLFLLFKSISFITNKILIASDVLLRFNNLKRQGEESLMHSCQVLSM